ncbi:phosphatidylserine decarboxylase, variant 2 [Trifolium repens]|nr:phosphatidylserine decarboxylase, variant 2 [Trifolium repens]
MDSHGTSPFSPSKEVLQQSDYTFQVSYSLIFPALPIQRSGLNRTSAEIHLWHTGAKAYNCVSSCRILELLRESSSRLGMDKANVYFILDLKVYDRKSQRLIEELIGKKIVVNERYQSQTTLALVGIGSLRPSFFNEVGGSRQVIGRRRNCRAGV